MSKCHMFIKKRKRKTIIHARRTYRLLVKRPSSFYSFSGRKHSRSPMTTRPLNRTLPRFRLPILRKRDQSRRRQNTLRKYRANDSDGDNTEQMCTSKWMYVSCKNVGDVSAAGTIVGGTRATKVAAARRGTQVRLRLSRTSVRSHIR